jgi:hypothetical protein
MVRRQQGWPDKELINGPGTKTFNETGSSGFSAGALLALHLTISGLHESGISADP